MTASPVPAVCPGLTQEVVVGLGWPGQRDTTPLGVGWMTGRPVSEGEPVHGLVAQTRTEPTPETASAAVEPGEEPVEEHGTEEHGTEEPVKEPLVEAAVDVTPEAATDAVPTPGVEPTTADDDGIPLVGADTPLAQSLATDTRRRLTLTGTTFPKPARTRVMTVANQKGGVGKTTTTVNIAAALAQSGLEVLVIDLDPQGNASTALGIDHHSEVRSVYDVLVEDVAIADVVAECPNVPGLTCVPATIDLAGAEIELVSLVAREQRLARALATYLEQAPVDYVLIDCPPSLGLLTINAFVAASEVFIPIQCEYYALEGLSQLLKNIELVRKHLNPALRVSTILLTMYDGRTRLSSQVADEVRAHFPQEVLPTSIPRSVRVSEAPSFQETVMTYDPLSSGALAYLEAASHIAARGAAPRETGTSTQEES